MGEKTKWKEESGAALVIALIMIIALTLIGLAATFNSTYEIRLSGNKRASTDAFYLDDSRIEQTKGHIKDLVPLENPAKVTPEAKDPYSDTGFSDEEKKSGLTNLGDYGEAIANKYVFTSANIHDGTNFPEFKLEGSGFTGNDTPEVRVYRSTCSAGSGRWIDAKAYIIDAIETDQITSVGLFKARCHLRSKIMVLGVSTDESQ
jgi:hypothetical protein